MNDNKKYSYDDLIELVNRNFEIKVNIANAKLALNNTNMRISNLNMGYRGVTFLIHAVPAVLGSIPILHLCKILCTITYAGYVALFHGIAQGTLFNGIGKISEKAMPFLKRTSEDLNQSKQYNLSLKRNQLLSSISRYNSKIISFDKMVDIYTNLLTYDQQQRKYSMKDVKKIYKLLQDNEINIDMIFFALILGQIDKLAEISTYSQKEEIRYMTYEQLTDMRNLFTNLREKVRQDFHAKLTKLIASSNEINTNQAHLNGMFYPNNGAVYSNNGMIYPNSGMLPSNNRMQQPNNRISNNQIQYYNENAEKSENAFTYRDLIDKLLQKIEKNINKLNKRLNKINNEIDAIKENPNGQIYTQDKLNYLTTSQTDIKIELQKNYVKKNNLNGWVKVYYEFLTPDEKYYDLDKSLFDKFDYLLQYYDIETLTLCLLEKKLDYLFSGNSISSAIRGLSNEIMHDYEKSKTEAQKYYQQKFLNCFQTQISHIPSMENRKKH